MFAYNTVYDTGIGLQIQIVGAGAPVELRGSVMTKAVSGTATSDNNLLNVSAADFKKFVHEDVSRRSHAETIVRQRLLA